MLLLLSLLDFPVVHAQAPAQRCGETCDAQVLQVGKRTPVPGLPLRIGDQLLESDEAGSVLFSDQGQEKLRVIVLDPAWSLREGHLPTGTNEERILWVEDSRKEALGVYRGGSHFTGQRLDREAISTLPGSLQDPVRAIQNLPGAARSPMNAGWLLVRGVEPENSRFFWAGLPLPQLYHLGGFASVFHPETIRAVEFQQMGWVNRSSGLGGEVNLESEGRTEQKRVEVGADVLNGTAFLAQPLSDNLGLSASVRHSWLRAALALAQGEEAARIAPSFSDWSIGIQGQNQALLYLGFVDVIDAPTADGEQILQVGLSSHQLMGQKHWRSASSRLSLSALLATKRRALSKDGEALSTHEDQQGRIHTELSHRAGNAQFLGGADLGLGRFGVLLSPQQLFRTWESTEAFFAVEIGQRQALALGLRNTHLWVDSQGHRLGLNPAIRLSIPLLEALEIQAQASRRHQAPNMDWLIGDPEGAYLPLERSDELSTAISWGQAVFRASAEAFLKDLQNLAMREEDGTIGAFSGRAYGLESALRWQGETLSLGLVAGFSRSLRQESDAHEEQPHALDPGIQLLAIGEWDGPSDWTLSARFRYASGVPFQSDRPSAYDLLLQQEVLRKPTVNPGTGRLPDPHALDLKIAKRRTYKNWRLEAYLDLQNIANRRVPEPILTGFEEKAVFGFGMPFLPVLGIEGSFWPR